MAAELALLVLFVYIPIILGGLYLGWLSVAREQVHESNHYAIYRDGDQSETLAERGENEGEFFGEFTGQLQVEERDADEADVPMPGELREMFEEFTVPIYYHHVSARGSFALQGNTVVYRENVQEESGFQIRPEGQVVNNLRLLEDNIPEDMTSMLEDYMHRRQAHSAYLHGWVHDSDPVVAGDRGAGRWNLWVPNAPRASRDEWYPEAAVRWTKTRMTGDQTPPGASEREDVGAPLRLPDPDPSMDFWHPSDLPQPVNPPAPVNPVN